MKILLISSEYYSKEGGGIGIYLHNFCKYLIQNGHHVSLITSSEKNLESKEILQKLDFHRVPYLNIPFIGILHWSISTYFLSKKLNNIYNFDIINPHLPTSHFFTLFYKLKTPIVLTIHNSFLNYGTRKIGIISKGVSIIRDILSVRNSNAVICLNNELKNELRKYCIKNTIFKIPLGVSLDEIQNYSFKKMPDKLFRVLFVGRIVEGKGLEYLLKAIRLLNDPTMTLLIVGDGPLKHKLEKEYGHINNVTFLGKIEDRKKLFFTYNNSDVLVIPSEGEGMPTVLIEGMACGLPIIATALPGIKEVVNSNFCWLVKPRNETEIAEALKDLSKNRVLLKAMSVESLKESQKYTWTFIGDTILNVFDAVKLRESKNN